MCNIFIIVNPKLYEIMHGVELKFVFDYSYQFLLEFENTPSEEVTVIEICAISFLYHREGYRVMQKIQSNLFLLNFSYGLF